MKKLLVFFVVAVTFMFAATAAFAGTTNGGTAVPAGTATFSGCTARFVRSASGIVNETNRVCPNAAQNPWASADVYLQFRPINGTPNSNCDPNGLVTPQFNWSLVQESNDIAVLGKWFGTVTYNVCVYLVNPVVAFGTLASDSPDGVTTAALPLSGKYQICVDGTWQNGSGGSISQSDAEFTTEDNWVTQHQGYNIAPYLLGPYFGAVQINENTVSWGAYNDGHHYCNTATYSAPINLAVFDGDSTTGVKNIGWYADNYGTLSYSVLYVGQ
jgi:hypothetical protein